MTSAAIIHCTRTTLHPFFTNGAIVVHGVPEVLSESDDELENLENDDLDDPVLVALPEVLSCGDDSDNDDEISSDEIKLPPVPASSLAPVPASSLAPAPVSALAPAPAPASSPSPAPAPVLAQEASAPPAVPTHVLAQEASAPTPVQKSQVHLPIRKSGENPDDFAYRMLIHILTRANIQPLSCFDNIALGLIKQGIVDIEDLACAIHEDASLLSKICLTEIQQDSLNRFVESNIAVVDSLKSIFDEIKLRPVGLRNQHADFAWALVKKGFNDTDLENLVRRDSDVLEDVGMSPGHIVDLRKFFDSNICSTVATQEPAPAPATASSPAPAPAPDHSWLNKYADSDAKNFKLKDEYIKTCVAAIFAKLQIHERRHKLFIMQEKHPDQQEQTKQEMANMMLLKDIAICLCDHDVTKKTVITLLFSKDAEKIGTLVPKK